MWRENSNHVEWITNKKRCLYSMAYSTINMNSLAHAFTILCWKYYLKHEQECFTGYKTRGEAEWFISDKARTASVLNGFKNDPFYTHLISLFTKNFSK